MSSLLNAQDFQSRVDSDWLSMFLSVIHNNLWLMSNGCNVSNFCGQGYFQKRFYLFVG